MEAPRPISELRESGLLWLINAAVFHPRGFALALVVDDEGELLGWSIDGDGSEPWCFAEDLAEARFAAAEATLAAARVPGG